MSESQYKPCAVYQRHNREWTPNEVSGILKILGFTDVFYTTNYDKIDDPYPGILKLFREIKCVTIPDEDFGPEIVAIGKKEEHLTLDTCTDMDRRWPTWLYTGYANYRKRPAVFPDLVGEDFA